ncbi:MAG: hypothetical protein IIB57_11525 [Planctomycetes bacterium]|nr:hypothetical protein [Planctomycetota bacterium]
MMLALWVFSVLFVLYYESPNSRWAIALTFGRISFGDWNENGAGWTCMPVYSELRFFAAEMPWTEFAHKRLGFSLPRRDSRGVFRIPVWLLVVAVGFPTAILWWRDRRPKAGFCKVCKYDLTGNVSGTCPECGTAVEDASETNEATTPTDGA